MNEQVLNRRSAFGALGSFGFPLMGTANAASSFDFEDPAARFEARLKTTGTLAEETVHRLSTGHVWMYHPETHQFDPFCTMENYNVTEWTHDDAVAYTHRRAQETKAKLVGRLLLEKKKRSEKENGGRAEIEGTDK